MGACCVVGARADIEEIDSELMAGDGPWTVSHRHSGVVEADARRHLVHCLEINGVFDPRSKLQAQPAGPADAYGYVYFIQGADGGPVKIGKSYAPESRLRGLQTGSPDALRLVAVIPGYDEVEAKIHRRFAPARIRGEWFEPTNELRAFIEGACAAGVGQAAGLAAAEIGRLREEKAALLDELSWHKEAEVVHGYSHKELVIKTLKGIAAKRDAARAARLDRLDAEMAAALAAAPLPPTAPEPKAGTGGIEAGTVMATLVSAKESIRLDEAG